MVIPVVVFNRTGDEIALDLRPADSSGRTSPAEPAKAGWSHTRIEPRAVVIDLAEAAPHAPATAPGRSLAGRQVP